MLRSQVSHTDDVMPAVSIRGLTGNMRAMASLAPWICAACIAAEIPPGPLADLESEDFRTREQAQAKILEWGRSEPAEAKELLYDKSIHAAEPEVRERCLAVLRELVGDEYSKEGEGFIGVRMQEETAIIPGDPERRGVIRVTFVMPKSPAEAAGLQINDLIAGIENKVWHEMPVLIPFSDEVRKFKPGSTVKLSVMRDNKLLEIPVTLTRRPLIADNPFLQDQGVDIETAEAAAREAYFKRWLERRKIRE
jgi:hypothetical protein